MSEQFTDGDWTVGGEILMDGHFEVITNASKPSYEWVFVATAHSDDDEETRGEHPITREQALANAHLIAASKKLFGSIDPDTLEAIADEIDGFEHSARAHSLRVVARKQREALDRARGKVAQPEVVGFV